MRDFICTEIAGAAIAVGRRGEVERDIAASIDSRGGRVRCVERRIGGIGIERDGFDVPVIVGEEAAAVIVEMGEDLRRAGVADIGRAGIDIVADNVAAAERDGARDLATGVAENDGIGQADAVAGDAAAGVGAVAAHSGIEQRHIGAGNAAARRYAVG